MKEQLNKLKTLIHTLPEKEQEELRSIHQQLNKEHEIIEFKIKRLLFDKQVTVNFLNQTVEQLEDTNKQLKDSNQQLNNFVHIASHDLKSPLRSISSFSGLLKKTAYQKLDEKEINYLNIIEQSAVSMSSLINDLLDYARINSESLSITSFSVDDVVLDIVKFLDFEIKANNCKIINAIKPHELKADREKIHLCFKNLISNGIKFSKTKEQPQVELRCNEFESHFEYTVRDNGIGINEKYSNQIFNEFKRLNGNEYEGTGMGLSIVKKIVEKHNGTISVQSAINEWTEMTFTISKNSN